MKRILTTCVGIALPFLALSIPVVALAICDNTSGNSLCSPTGSNTSLSLFVENALRAFVMLALPVLAFFIVLAGFNFVFARGNAQKLELAKWNFLFVIIGTCLVLGAWLFANLIGGAVTQITG